MTTEQLENTENIVRGLIEKKQSVYATVSPLAVAKDIQGLRAIFDEVKLWKHVLLYYAKNIKTHSLENKNCTAFRNLNYIVN